MKNILIIGAGRSSGALIGYVLKQAERHGWNVVVADTDPEAARQKINGHPNGRAAWLDVHKVNDRRDLINRADVVVSLLPAHLHLEVGQDCITLNKHLITASYVSKEMYQLGDLARSRDLVFMGEMGLDPGIDHMSAMKIIHDIQQRGGEIRSFSSYTGGLVCAEDLTDNPWKYKFTWNPRNVVLAGQGTAQYLEDGRYKYIPYNRLFSDIRKISIPELGEFEVYANRDSLLYREVYGLKDIPTIVRGTIRYPGYCAGWDALVKIGLTDDSYPIVDSEELTYHELMNAFVSHLVSGSSVRDRVAEMLGETPHSKIMKKLDWLGLFRKIRIQLPSATPAQILEHLLLERWKLEPTDRDLILMQHEFEYELEGESKTLVSTLVMRGEDSERTAMSKLVGLPMGILVKELMLGNIKQTGTQVPVERHVYGPVLEELENYGVVFQEEYR